MFRAVADSNSTPQIEKLVRFLIERFTKTLRDECVARDEDCTG
jgi:hypothetical protein